MRPSATAGLTQSAHSGITRGTSPVHARGVHVSPMSTCPLAQVSLRSDEACPGIGGAVAGAGPSTARRRRPAMIASRLVLISLGQSGPATMCPIWAGIQPDDSSPLVNVAREVHQGSSELQAASPWPKRSSGRSWRNSRGSPACRVTDTVGSAGSWRARPVVELSRESLRRRLPLHGFASSDRRVRRYSNGHMQDHICCEPSMRSRGMGPGVLSFRHV